MNVHKNRYRQDPAAITTVLNSDEAVIVHADTKLSYALNATGITIWNLLKESRTVDDLTKGVCDAFNVNREHARDGVIRFIEELLSFRLIGAVNQEKR